MHRYSSATTLQVSNDRNVRAFNRLPEYVSSCTEMTEASDESFSMATKSLPNGGRMTRIACGKTTWRIDCQDVIPSDRAASRWPLAIDSIPARYISAR